ncbi:glycosyltransferase family 4 protein [Rhodobacteraceae bacterium NNCM2]|nr:glycosyltransferase family 4 protein [Coraliihabitans acroporae]
MIRARFAFPGDLQTPTGGYGYARRVMAEAPRLGLTLDPLPLPAGFPAVSEEAIRQAGALLAEVPGDEVILLDGLAGGVLPGEMLMALPAPVVMLCHHPLALETGLDPSAQKRLHALERAALAASDRVVTTSHTTAVTLGASFGVPLHRITVAPPGTDPARQAAGSGGPTVRILSVGSISPRKGHHLLVEVLAPLAGEDWHLAIAGSVLDARYAGALERRIDELALQDRVELLGALDAEQLDREYDGADLFVLASQFEGFGMAFTEAMARGLPVVGFPVGAVAEATLGAARLVAPGTLTDELAPLLRDAGARRALGDQCAGAAANFTRWSDTAAILRRAISEVMP